MVVAFCSDNAISFFPLGLSDLVSLLLQQRVFCSSIEIVSIRNAIEKVIMLIMFRLFVYICAKEMLRALRKILLFGLIIQC